MLTSSNIFSANVSYYEPDFMLNKDALMCHPGYISLNNENKSNKLAKNVHLSKNILNHPKLVCWF